MDGFSNVGNVLLGIHPADKVVGIKPLQKRDGRRRKEQRHEQGEGMTSEEEALTYHRFDSPFPLEQGEGSDGAAIASVEGETGPSDNTPEPRKVDVVV